MAIKRVILLEQRVIRLCLMCYNFECFEIDMNNTHRDHKCTFMRDTNWLAGWLADCIHAHAMYVCNTFSHNRNIHQKSYCVCYEIRVAIEQIHQECLQHLIRAERYLNVCMHVKNESYLQAKSVILFHFHLFQ